MGEAKSGQGLVGVGGAALIPQVGLGGVHLLGGNLLQPILYQGGDDTPSCFNLAVLTAGSASLTLEPFKILDLTVNKLLARRPPDL